MVAVISRLTWFLVRVLHVSCEELFVFITCY